MKFVVAGNERGSLLELGAWFEPEESGRDPYSHRLLAERAKRGTLNTEVQAVGLLIQEGDVVRVVLDPWTKEGGPVAMRLLKEWAASEAPPLDLRFASLTP